MRNKATAAVIPDLDAFQANVVEGAAKVSFSKSFSTTLKKSPNKFRWLEEQRDHEHFIPSERWNSDFLPPSLMMLRAAAQQVADQGRPAGWFSGLDWPCSSSTRPWSSCDFLPSQWCLLQYMDKKQTVKSSLFTVFVVSLLIVSALRLLLPLFFLEYALTC